MPFFTLSPIDKGAEIFEGEHLRSACVRKLSVEIDGMEMVCGTKTFMSVMISECAVGI